MNPAELTYEQAKAEIDRLAAVMNDESAPHEEQLAAAIAILDHAYGEPEQSVVVEHDG